MATARVTGTVKWFDETKGFGFITPDDGGPDVLAHFSNIAIDNFRVLTEGQRVSYKKESGPKGDSAVNIQQA